MLLRVGSDESALALAPQQQVLGGKLVDRLAHRSLADPEAPREVHFTRDGFTRFPLAGLQALQNEGLDLLVERAEGRRPRYGRIGVERTRSLVGGGDERGDHQVGQVGRRGQGGPSYLV